MCLLDTLLELFYFLTDEYMKKQGNGSSDGQSMSGLKYTTAQLRKVRYTDCWSHLISSDMHLSYDLLVIECSFTWAYEGKVSERAHTHTHTHTLNSAKQLVHNANNPELQMSFL